MQIPIKRGRPSGMDNSSAERNETNPSQMRDNNVRDFFSERKGPSVAPVARNFKREPLIQKMPENFNGKKSLDKELAKKVVDWIIKASIYLTVFFIPLLFIPVVPSVLEMNKQFMLVIVVGLGFLAWVGKMAWANEIRFKKNFYLIPLLTFLVIMSLSTIFSKYPAQSFWGGFGSESYSLISWIFLAALFMLIYNNINSRKEIFKVLFLLLVGGFFVAFFGVLQLFGKFILPSEVFKNPFFNSVGSVYVFGTYVAALLVLSVSMFLDDISKIAKIVLAVLSFFFMFILIAIDLNVIWLSLLLALALLMGAAFIKSGGKTNQSRILPMVFMVLALLSFLFKKPMVNVDKPTEVLLSTKTSASIMFSSWKQDPLLGAGPGNYSLVYQVNRPENLGSFWSVNFANAKSYFFTLASTVGILGTASFLFLVLATLFILFKGVTRELNKKVAMEAQNIQNKEISSSFLIIGSGAVWMFLTLIIFFYLANMTILTLWWLSLALFMSAVASKEERKDFVATSENAGSSFSLSFAFVLVIIGLITSIYLQTQKYVAAARFNDALTMDAKGEPIDQITEKITKAISIDPSNDLYFRNLSVAYFAQANKIVAEKGADLSADDSGQVSNFIIGAINTSENAKSISPNDPQNYISVAGIYEGLITTMDQADKRAIENYQEAVKYDPRNPALYQKIASIYVTLSDIEMIKQAQQNKDQQNQELPEKSKEYLGLAINNIQKALELKPDYVDANLLLASVYEREGDLDKAIEKEKQNVDLYSGAPSVALRLGLLYYKQENWQEAETAFRNALKLDENYANARYFLGFALYKQGKEADSLAEFKMIQKTNQENEDLNKIIDNLENGRDIAEGLNQNHDQQAIEEEQPAQSNQEPRIKPNVENQEIPAEATPTVEEIDQLPEGPQVEGEQTENPEENPESGE